MTPPNQVCTLVSPTAMARTSLTLSLALSAPARDFAPPVLALGPHVAALGMRFYTGAMFPPTYRNQIFIAPARLLESQQKNRLSRHACAA